MSEADDDSNVSVFPIKTLDKTVPRYLIPQRTSNCAHGPFLIDQEKAEVECQRCGEKINPMFALWRLATQERNWIESRERMIEEQKRLDDRLRTKCQHCKQITRISRS